MGRHWGEPWGDEYLTLSGLEVGLLLNFHNWPLKDGGIRRVVNTRT